MGDEIVYSLWKHKVARHAAAYTIMSFRIAWFKRHYPTAFYAAILTKKNEGVSHEYYFMSAADLFNEIRTKASSGKPKEKKEASALEIIYDAKMHGIEFVRPNLSESKAALFIPKDNKVILPFSAIKGLGEKVAQNIEAERDKRQFNTLDDFKSRTKINRTQFNALKKLGVLDHLSDEQLKLF